jgi:hypothetical protein
MEKTLQIHLQEQREKIAKDIVKFMELNVDTNWVHIRSFKVASDIALGAVKM